MRMSLVPTGVVVPGVWAVRVGTVNFFVLRSADALIAVDTGFDRYEILRELARLGIRPSDVTHVFLTHSDPDHVGGLPLFSHALVYIGEDEVPLACGSIPRALGIRNRVAHEDLHALPDLETVQVGEGSVKAVATPGHTPGSTSYLIDGLLFTGDALSVKDGVVFEGRRLYTMDRSTRLQSVDRILGLGSRGILTAHSGVFLDPQREIARASPR